MTSDLRGLAAALGIVGLALLACKGLRSEKEDTNPPATTAPTASEAPKKEAVVDVTRYPDEQAASGTARPNGDAVARQAATPSAKSVGNVKAGDELGLVAAHEGFVLVSVTDDGVAGQLGWVPRSAFGDLPGIEAKPVVKSAPSVKGKVSNPTPAVPPPGGGGASDFAKAIGPDVCPDGFRDDFTYTSTCARICTSNANCHAPNKCVPLVGITKTCSAPL